MLGGLLRSAKEEHPNATGCDDPSLPRAFELVKGRRAQGLEWDEGYRGLGRAAIAAVLAGQMGQAIDEHLDRMAALDQPTGATVPTGAIGLTELGGIELLVPRTRRFAPVAMRRAYARRAAQLDRMILACFVLGLSARKVGEALLPILGRPSSPATVSPAPPRPGRRRPRDDLPRRRQRAVGGTADRLSHDPRAALLGAQNAQCPGVRCAVPTSPPVKADLQAVMNAKTLPQAPSAARRFADR